MTKDKPSENRRNDKGMAMASPSLSVSRATAPYSLDESVQNSQTDMVLAERHRRDAVLATALADHGKVADMYDTLARLLPQADDFLKGYVLGMMTARTRPVLYSQPNPGYPQPGEVAIGYIPDPDSDSATPVILIRLAEGSWLDRSTGEVIDRTKVLAWMPLPTLSQN